MRHCLTTMQRLAQPMPSLARTRRSRCLSAADSFDEAARSEEPRDAALPDRPFLLGELFQVNVRGVSFGTRQATLAALPASAPLLFQAEPENPADPTAVAVLTLGGVALGYVPKELTLAFEHTPGDAACGRAAQSGLTEGGLVWLAAQARPAGPAALADLHPLAAAPRNLSTTLPEAAWNALRRRAYAAAGMRCQACGGRGPAHPVEAHERWRFNPGSRTALLRGVVALCPNCHRTAHWRTATAPAVLAHAAAVNGWTASDAQVYADYVQTERRRRAALGPWSIDASWLRTQGLGDAEVAAAEAPFRDSEQL